MAANAPRRALRWLPKCRRAVEDARVRLESAPDATAVAAAVVIAAAAAVPLPVTDAVRR